MRSVAKTKKQGVFCAQGARYKDFRLDCMVWSSKVMPQLHEFDPIEFENTIRTPSDTDSPG